MPRKPFRQTKRPPRSRTSDAVRLDSYPPPYPDGWYRLLGSGDLRPGDVRYLECLGRELVVWRSEDALSVHAMTAFCPHMGANLGHGRVKGDRVVCPFHAWEMTGRGRVACLPYSDHAPERTLNETFPMQDVHGQLFMYHRNGDTPQRSDDEPPYLLPRVAEIDEGRFVFRGHHDAGRVRMHIIEFAENSVDFAHFVPIHSRMRLPWTSIPVPGIEIEHAAAWELDEERPHVTYFFDTAVLRIFGKRVERAGANARATFTGPGSVVNFRFDIQGVGGIELYQTHLPISPLEQQVDFHWFADRKIPRLLVSYVVGNWVSQWRQDIEIWENKIYQRKPMLSKDDGPVQRMRHWYKQFYPEQDPSPVEPMSVRRAPGDPRPSSTPVAASPGRH
jgi:cholesterol 7-dehydrogenase